MAEAIQVASRWEARPVRAVTSPPPPRLIEPSSWWVTGPRLETSTRGADCSTPPNLPLEQPREDAKPVAEQPGREEVAPHVLLATPPEVLGQCRIAEDAQRAVRALLDRGDQIAGLSVVHLERDASDPATDERPGLPDGLADREPEALARRLLDDHVGVGLEGVDLDRADVVEVVEDVDVRVAGGVGDGGVEEVPAPRVVGGHGADERELHLGDVLLDHAVGVDDPERVLPGIEARDLAHERPVDVDPELLADERGVLG